MKLKTKYVQAIGSICLLLIAFLLSCQNGQPSVKTEKIILEKERIAFGKELFFDTRLSSSGQVSCATCHKPQFNFADNVAFSQGSHGRKAKRNTPSIVFASKQPYFMYEGLVPSLEMQALVPLQDSNEMDNSMSKLIERLNGIPDYNKKAKLLYDRPFDAYVLTRSLAFYVRSLSNKKHPFLSFMAGNKNAMTRKQRRGYQIFDRKLKCTSCHTPPYLTNHQVTNNGLAINKQRPDLGKFQATNDPKDYAAFKTPSLLGLLKSNPYMHDGRFKTIRAVVNHYQKGGSHVKNKDQRIKRFNLTAKEKSDLLAFLRSL